MNIRYYAHDLFTDSQETFDRTVKHVEGKKETKSINHINNKTITSHPIMLRRCIIMYTQFVHSIGFFRYFFSVSA